MLKTLPPKYHNFTQIHAENTQKVYDVIKKSSGIYNEYFSQNCNIYSF